MATVQTIATTLTADSRPAVQSLRTFDAEVGKAFTRLDAMNKKAFSNPMGGAGGGLANVGRQSSDGARGLLELSRGAEDAAVSFGLNGVQGAIRGSLNNLTQFATMMGGPVAGAIAGFTAAGVSIASPYIASLFEATEATKQFMAATDLAIERAKSLLDTRTKRAEEIADLRRELGGIDESKDARSAIGKREQEVEKLTIRLKELAEAQERLRGLATPQMSELEQRAFKEASPDDQAALMERWAKADQLSNEMTRERLELIRKETELRSEIGTLKEKEIALLKEEQELQRQKDAEEFANIIRKFQEQDEKEEELRRKREEDDARRKQERDADKLENILESRIRGLGGKTDPLEGMDLPDEMKGRLGGLLEQIDEFNKKPTARFAQVATADSQSLLRSQYMAKEAAERKKEAERLRQILEDMLREIKEARRGQQAEEDKDDVNLS